MEPIRYVNIATFATGPEAHIARSALEAAGISAQVTGEAAVTAIWHVGSALGGVKLMVAEKDVPAARKILAEADLASEPIDESFEDYDVDGESDERSDVDDDPRPSADETAGAAADTNPYRSPRASQRQPEDGQTHDEEADEALANRIWRSSVFGLVLCPPVINSYSLLLLMMNLDLFGRVHPRHKWKLWAAAVIDVLVVGTLGLFLWSMVGS
jgi:hypothetical protein